MALFLLAASWLIGIIVASQFIMPTWGWAVAGAALLMTLIMLRRYRRTRLVVGCMLLLVLGGARMSLSQGGAGSTDISMYNGSGFVTVEDMIVEAPQMRDAFVTFHLRVHQIELDGADIKPISGVVIVQAPNVTAYRYGDVLSVRGELNEPVNSGDFSYRDYLARQNIYSQMRYAVVQPTGERRGSPIRAALLDFRSRAHTLIQRMLPDPQASLLAGILLGIESGISPDLADAFNAVGATHVIAISGSNIAIIAALALSISGRFLKPNGSAAVTIATVFIYAMFVGGDPAVTRAAIMTTLGLVAARLGRETYGLTSLAFAALLLTAIDPHTLWDVGFQLSFMATLGLILYVRPLQDFIARLLEKVFKAETTQKIVAATSDTIPVTIGAQIATAPLTIYQFGRFSPYSLLVSFLIVPAQQYLMVLGGLGVLLGLVIFPLGQLFAWGSWLFLSWTIGVVEFFAGLPGASPEFAPLSEVGLVLIYALLFFVGWVSLQPDQDRERWFSALKQGFSVKFVGMMGVLSALILFSATTALPDNQLHITMLDVGRGSALLIETPSGRQILIDAGGSGRRLSAEVGAELPFWDRNLDLVILTQPTSSHAGGLATLLNRWRFDSVMTNGHHGDSDLSEALWARLQAQGTREVLGVAGMSIDTGDGVQITVLQGDLGIDEGSGDPLVIMISYGDLRIFISGDLAGEAQAALINSEQYLDATVMIAPRGGHQEAASDALLAAVTPNIVLISPTDDGLPHEETIARLEALGSLIYRVDEQGSIHITSDGHQVWVKTKQ